MTDFGNLDAILKQHYHPNKVESLTLKNNVALSTFKRNKKAGGREIEYPVVIAGNGAMSSAFSTAQGKASTNSTTVSFKIPRQEFFAITRIDNHLIEASEGNENAFASSLTLEQDELWQQTANFLEYQLFSNGFGQLAVVKSGSGVSSTTLQLQDPTSALNIQPNFELAVVSGSDPTNSLRAFGSAGKGLIVKAVDPVNGTIEIAYAADDATNGVPTIAAGDGLVLRGTYDGDGKRKLICGLDGWIEENPSSDLFFGVDRTDYDKHKLCGQVISSPKTKAVEDTLIDMAYALELYGESPDICYMHPTVFKKLVKEIGSKTEYVNLQATAQISHKAYELILGSSTVKVVPARACPANRIFMGKLDSVEILSIGDVPRNLATKGFEMLTASDANAAEIRTGYYANCAIYRPIAWVKAKLV